MGFLRILHSNKGEYTVLEELSVMEISGLNSVVSEIAMGYAVSIIAIFSDLPYAHLSLIAETKALDYGLEWRDNRRGYG